MRCAGMGKRYFAMHPDWWYSTAWRRVDIEPKEFLGSVIASISPSLRNPYIQLRDGGKEGAKTA